MRRAERAAEVVARLSREYPDWTISLDSADPWQLLVATILSAQSTDAMVNRITPALFAAYPTAKHLAEADPRAVERLVHACGYFHQKTRHIIGASRRIVEHHGGEVPRTMEDLTELPGVARKTANVVLHNAFHDPHGIAVDTHVGRLARRLALTRNENPVRVERDLMRVLARDDWHRVTHLLIEHGRRVCTARSPKCEGCVLLGACPAGKRIMRSRSEGAHRTPRARAPARPRSRASRGTTARRPGRGSRGRA